jgi:uncharacterized protein YjbI with pentapeptide repeats
VPGRPDLRADCARCFGLCCVVPAFSVSADFAIDKAAGQPCPHLGPGFGCGIHRQLRQRGFPGCAAYDCFGAGQKVAQVTFGGQDWRQAPNTARQMFAAFTVMRQLHELLRYLAEALALPAARPLYGELRRALEQTERLSGSRPDALVALDVDSGRQHANALLVRASELARAGLGPRGSRADHRGADLTGARPARREPARREPAGGPPHRGRPGRGGPEGADLTGVDLRAADLSGADLAGAIFLTQSQLDAARGDAGTRLPASLARPAHWRPDARTAG